MSVINSVYVLIFVNRPGFFNDELIGVVQNVNPSSLSIINGAAIDVIV